MNIDLYSYINTLLSFIMLKKAIYFLEKIYQNLTFH